MSSRRIAFTRDVTPGIVHCELTHLERTPVDLVTARRQHDEYEAALKQLGCEVRRLNADPDWGDAVFVEDTAVVLPEVAVIARPGAESRRREVAAVAEALKPHRKLIRIEAPATLDGGDVIVAGKMIYVGQTSRTNAFGREALVRATARYGYQVDGITITQALHLKSAATLVADDTILLNPKWAWPQAFGRLKVIETDPTEPWGGNALRIGDAVIYPSEFPRTRARLEAAGIRTVPVPNGELAKAEGGVTCCSIVFQA